ncbi:MFS transporter [Sodalis ligni]|uniref:MFS transporter n=1 Tax=Sodalis TaxID=84565 RepID=UPI00193F510B|nr:MFS transporter [Sodalis ligni]QWA11424.1 MFS transporter [Sodalis ligni]
MTQPSQPPALSRRLTLILATACGLIVANIYYAQPLAGEISRALGLSPQAAGLIVTMTQIGYGLGLLLIVPLGDLFENRGLTLCVMGVGIAALATAVLAHTVSLFLTAAVFIGLGSVAVQILVPYAAHLSAPALRGKAVGDVMSGLMLGIMLARPVSSLITHLSSWRMVFIISTLVMILLTLTLGYVLPVRRPAPGLRYRALMASIGSLAVHNLTLRRRALYHAALFGAFSLFWTVTPLLLTGPEFHLSQVGVALFAFAGVAGAIAAPIAGRVADRGLSKPATLFAMLAAGTAFLLTHIGDTGSHLKLGILVLAAILLDFGVTMNLVIGQRAIFALGEHYRSRLNGIYMATFFVGGAIGSALGGWAYAQGGWGLASLLGTALPAIALCYFASERPATE